MVCFQWTHSSVTKNQICFIFSDLIRARSYFGEVISFNGIGDDDETPKARQRSRLQHHAQIKTLRYFRRGENIFKYLAKILCGEGYDVSQQGCQMAKFDPCLSLDCARVEGVGAQSKERKGSNFAA